MKKLLFVILIMVLETMFIVGCTIKEKPKKDDFLNPQTTEAKEEKKSTRIKIIDDGDAWHTYQILEVDGHQYLANSKGGFIHLESCPCKNK
jgi:hypothetical protein